MVALGRWGALEAARSGQHDEAFDREIRSYQTDNGLEPDGILLPGGPTQTKLNQSLTASPLGPSLLESPRTSEPANSKGPEFPQPRSSDSDWLSSAPIGRLHHFPVPKQHFQASGADDLSRISEQTRRTMEEAAGMQRGSLSVDEGASPSLSEIEQIMITHGYKYLPDRDTANSDYPLWHDLATRLNSALRRVAAGESGLTLRLTTSGSDVEATGRKIIRINAAFARPLSPTHCVSAQRPSMKSQVSLRVPSKIEELVSKARTVEFTTCSWRRPTPRPRRRPRFTRADSSPCIKWKWMRLCGAEKVTQANPPTGH